jgi:peptidoglycan/LPS O-acetylase OafA/YrhL
VDPLVAKWLVEPRRLASGAVLGVLIGVLSIFLLGSEGHDVVSYIGVGLMVVPTAPWIVSVLYLPTERGRAARDEYLARRGPSRGHNWERPE